MTDGVVDAARAHFGFLGIRGPALALDALQFPFQLRQRRERSLGVGLEASTPRQLAQAGEALFQQEELAGGGDVQRRRVPTTCTTRIDERPDEVRSTYTISSS